MEVENTTTETTTSVLDAGVNATVAANSGTTTSGETAVAGKTTEGTESSATAAVMGTAAEQTIAAYSPNYKYKIKDQEFEFEDWAKNLAKEKTVEEKLRELYTKSHGLEEIKKARDEIKGKFEEVLPKYQGIEKSLNILSGYVKQGDLGSFFEALKIPEQLVLKYAVDRLKYSQLPPEERAKVDAAHQEKQQYRTIEEQNQALQEQVQQQGIAQRQMELNMVLSRQDVGTMATQYDTLVGRPGSFQQKIIEKGAAHYFTTGEDITAQQAAELVLAEVRPFLQGSSGTQQAAPGEGAAQAQQSGQTVVANQQAQKPAVIPNIQASGGSPVKKTVKTLDDIKKIREQRFSG